MDSTLIKSDLIPAMTEEYDEDDCSLLAEAHGVSQKKKANQMSSIKRQPKWVKNPYKKVTDEIASELSLFNNTQSSIELSRPIKKSN